MVISQNNYYLLQNLTKKLDKTEGFSQVKLITHIVVIILLMRLQTACNVQILHVKDVIRNVILKDFRFDDISNH